MPIHNEEGLIEGAVARVPSFVDLIIAVDDGSADATRQKLSQIKNERLINLRHEKNLGVGAATKTGYRYLLDADVDLIAVMDGDGQMDGRDLPALLDCAIEGADYVKGNRFLHRQSISAMPRARYIGNLAFSWLTRRAAGIHTGLDSQCGYTVIRRAALKRLTIDNLYDRYGFLNEMLFEAVSVGLRIESVPVRTIYGDEVSGINPLTTVPTLVYLIARDYLRLRLSFKPSSAIAFQQGDSNSAK